MKAFLSFVKLLHPAVESEIDGHGLYSNDIWLAIHYDEEVFLVSNGSKQQADLILLVGGSYYRKWYQLPQLGPVRLVDALACWNVTTSLFIILKKPRCPPSSGSTQVKQAMIQMNCLSLEALLAKKDNLAAFNTMEIEDQECLGAKLMEFGYFPIQKSQWKDEKHAYKQKEQMETMSTKQEDQYRKFQEDMDDMKQEQDRTLNKLLETEKQNEGLRNEADTYRTEIHYRLHLENQYYEKQSVMAKMETQSLDSKLKIKDLEAQLQLKDTELSDVEAALKAEAETLRQQKKDLHKQQDHIERLQEELGALQKSNADTGNPESVATDMHSPMTTEKNAMAHFSSCDDIRLKSVLLELKNSQMAFLEAQKEAADYHQVLKAMETKTFELETQLSQRVEDLPTVSSLEDQTTISDLRRELETQRYTIHIFYLNRNSEGTSVEIRGMNINESTSEIRRQLGRTLAQIAIANEQVLSFEQVLAPLVFVVIHGSSRISGFQARLKNVHKHIQRLDDTVHQQSSKTEGLQEQCDTLSKALSIEKEMAIQLQAKLAQTTASNEKYVLRLEQTLAHLALVVICGSSRLSRLQARLTRIHKHIQRLDSIIDQLSTKHKGLQQQCNEFEQAALVEQVAITQLKADCSTLSARCSASEAHVEELEQAISSEQKSSLNLQGEKKVLGEQNLKLQQKTEELQQQWDELEQAALAEQVSIAQLRADYSTVSAQCSALEQAISSEQSSSLNLQQENQELENQKIQFQQVIYHVQPEMSPQNILYQKTEELQQQCDELGQAALVEQVTITQLKADYSTLSARCSASEARAEELEQAISSEQNSSLNLQGEKQVLGEQNVKLQQKTEELQQQCDELEKAASAEQVSITQLRADYSTVSARCSALEQAISLEQISSLNLQQENQELENQKIQFQQHMDELQRQCDELVQIVSSGEDTTAQLRTNHLAALAQYMDLQTQTTEFQRNLSRAEQEHESLQLNYENLQQEYENLQLEHQTFDKDLVILYKTSQDPTRLQDTAKVLQDRKTAKPEMILTRSLVRLWLEALILKIEKLIFLHFDLVSCATRPQGPKDRKIFVKWLMEEMQVNSESQLQQIIRTMEGEGDEVHSQIESLKHENDMLHNNFEKLQEHYTQKSSESKNHTLMFMINQKAHILTQFQTNKELEEKKIQIETLQQELETAQVEIQDRDKNDLIVLSGVHALGMREVERRHRKMEQTEA
ncbi:hypothetical protein K438DRAFT_1776458 [Mycena galopus ATCC 62051]|nr:hypothetical protein K438DRAFT_1776458 [Mycena galopus ATCC 62051]